ncbi:hypothetical protein ROZALSC1DRAFT_29587 [Rozella allomycis CSF55]|uniref:Uncharacterized protein n=1 Tax=Rozella allomycis (strain CSF55) TaxID=988480 RepID=A0A4P9YJY5_ROZAC|nr:hypothetical protein ROZALSC1DRAFT_29587 [Rozella allomycis CSF55]
MEKSLDQSNAIVMKSLGMTPTKVESLEILIGLEESCYIILNNLEHEYNPQRESRRSSLSSPTSLDHVNNEQEQVLPMAVSNNAVFGDSQMHPTVIDENLVYAIAQLLKFTYMMLDHYDMPHKSVPSKIKIQETEKYENHQVVEAKFQEWLKTVANLCAKHATNENRELPSRTSFRSDLDFHLSHIQMYVQRGEMKNQKVELNDRQQKKMEGATIYRKIIQIQGKRLNDQRASYVDKLAKLETVIDQLMEGAKSSFDNQRVVLSDAKKSDMELLRITKLLEKSGSRRMDDQEVWVSQKQQKGEALVKISEKLADDNSKFSEQRFTVSKEKEKDMFVKDMFKRLDRIGTNLENQKSISPVELKEKRLDSVEKTLQRLDEFSYSDQRHEFIKKSKSSNVLSQ